MLVSMLPLLFWMVHVKIPLNANFSHHKKSQGSHHRKNMFPFFHLPTSVCLFLLLFLIVYFFREGKDCSVQRISSTKACMYLSSQCVPRYNGGRIRKGRWLSKMTYFAEEERRSYTKIFIGVRTTTAFGSCTSVREDEKGIWLNILPNTN